MAKSFAQSVLPTKLRPALTVHGTRSSLQLVLSTLYASGSRPGLRVPPWVREKSQRVRLIASVKDLQ